MSVWFVVCTGRVKPGLDLDRDPGESRFKSQLAYLIVMRFSWEVHMSL